MCTLNLNIINAKISQPNWDFRKAEKIIADAQGEANRLLSESDILRAVQKEAEKADPGKSWVLRVFKKVMPIKTDYHGENFFVRETNKWFATPLFAALLVIEMSDVVFAADSIPAVLGITQDTFLVDSSNIFAIIGLRSLYFLLNGMADKFPYLKYGISVILLFVGVKMLASHYIHIPVLLSLGIIVAILALAILASRVFPPKQETVW